MNPQVLIIAFSAIVVWQTHQIISDRVRRKTPLVLRASFYMTAVGALSIATTRGEWQEWAFVLLTGGAVLRSLAMRELASFLNPPIDLDSVEKVSMPAARAILEKHGLDKRLNEVLATMPQSEAIEIRALFEGSRFLEKGRDETKRMAALMGISGAEINSLFSEAIELQRRWERNGH